MKIAITSSNSWMAVVIATGLLTTGTSCQKDVVAPIAAFTINSHVAYTGRIITVDASDSKDPDSDVFSLQMRWDFEDDGVWDTDFSFDKQVNWSFQGAGYHRIRLEVKDLDNLTSQALDSVNLFGPFPDSVMLDMRDGQQYRIVKINGIWIMAENLRYGTRIASSIKQTNNGLVEYYAFDDDSANVPLYGGLYSQEEAMNYDMRTHNQGICPEGWRIPDRADWDQIDIKVAHYFLRDYYGPEGVSGLNLQFGGYFVNAPLDPYVRGIFFYGAEVIGMFWTTLYIEENDGETHRHGIAEIVNKFNENDYSHFKSGLIFYNHSDSYSHKNCYYLSVRCVNKNP